MATIFDKLKEELKQRNSERKSSPLEDHFVHWFNACKIYGYEREYNVLNYFLDFAWPELKFAVEADGDLYHFDRKDSDRARDKVLAKEGWTIYRVNSKEAWDYRIFIYHLKKIFAKTQSGNFLPYAIMELVGDPNIIIKERQRETRKPEHNNDYVGHCKKCDEYYFNNINCKCLI